jgi:hypothetical protein
VFRRTAGHNRLLARDLPADRRFSPAREETRYRRLTVSKRLRLLRRERGENRFQAIGRAINHTPRSDGGEIDLLKPLNSEHNSGVIEILRLWKPCRPAKTRQHEPSSSVELMLHKRIVEERKEFDEKGRIAPCHSDMPSARMGGVAFRGTAFGHPGRSPARECLRKCSWLGYPFPYVPPRSRSRVRLPSAARSRRSSRHARRSG